MKVKLFNAVDHPDFRERAKRDYGLTKLINPGGSFASILPMYWVEHYCYREEDKGESIYWIRITDNKDSTLTISPLSEDDISALTNLYMKVSNGKKNKTR